jgi:hypothetical protein
MVGAGWLGGLALLLSGSAAHAQSWPAPYGGSPMPGAQPPLAPAPFYAPPPGSTGTWAGPAPTYPVPTYRTNPVPAIPVYQSGPPIQALETDVATIPGLDDEPFGHKMPTATPRPAVAPGDPALPRNTVRFSVSYLQSFIRPAPVNAPLLVTGTATGSGVLGSPGTSLLFGNDNLRYNLGGIMAELGVWLDDDRHFSVDFGGFYLFPQHNQFARGSDATGTPLLTRPAIDALTGSPTAYLVSSPDIAAGRSVIDARATLAGADASARAHFCFSDCFSGQALLGYRFLRLAEQLNIEDQVHPLTTDVFSFLSTPVNPPSQLNDVDLFHTTNQFHGTQLGGSLRWQQSRFYLEGVGKVGLGITTQRVLIGGASTLINPDGTTQTAPGGILALSSNMGEHHRTVFGAVPEAGVNLGVDIFRNVRLKAGYSFLYWNSVVRPGNQIDPVVNPHLVPTDVTYGTSGGPARPAFTFRDQPFWMHSFNMGVEVHY